MLSGLFRKVDAQWPESFRTALPLAVERLRDATPRYRAFVPGAVFGSVRQDYVAPERTPIFFGTGGTPTLIGRFKQDDRQTLLEGAYRLSAGETLVFKAWFASCALLAGTALLMLPVAIWRLGFTGDALLYCLVSLCAPALGFVVGWSALELGHSIARRNATPIRQHVARAIDAAKRQGRS